MRLNRKQLIRVWLDTESRFSEYPDVSSYKTSGKYANWSSNYDLSKYKFSKVFVQNKDCIEVARELSLKGKVCMLNMASRSKPGGGVKSGAMAQEEELSRRSNLMVALQNFKYPLELNDVIFSNNVTFFKNGNYEMIKPFECSIITIAAINLNNSSKYNTVGINYGGSSQNKPSNYFDVMQSKIDSIFYESMQNKCEYLVLSAFGCGVFKNDPTEVSRMFAYAISRFSQYFKEIHFVILNDRNSVGNNYEIFKNAFKK